MRGVIKRETCLGLALPPSLYNASKEACPYYHIKGMRNARCGREGDHQPYTP